MHRKKLKDAKIIVIKIGSSTLTDKSGKLDRNNLQRIASEIADIISLGKKVIIVTSGAIVCGSERISKLKSLRSISQMQAAAAIGQGLLMKEYDNAFSRFEKPVAQVLLTRDAIADRERYLNTCNAIHEMIEFGAIPIVNENDTVSIDEIKIGDNDNLSALVANLVGADLLINLTDVQGFMIDGVVVQEIDKIDKRIEEAALPGGVFGRGGMVTKLQAAKICSDAGIFMIIASGRDNGIFSKILDGQNIGTLFIPREKKLDSRKRWLAHGFKPAGKVIIDEGAARALAERGSSLLGVGIKEVKGKFKPGDLISIFNLKGKEIARGLSNISSDETDKIKGLKSADSGYEEVIHRDNLVVL